VADCSRSGFQPLETHDRQQWTAVDIGSPATRMMTNEDGDGWNWNALDVVEKNTVAPNPSGIGK